MSTLADRLNARMTELGMTQERLARLAKVSQTAIHKLSTGKSKESRKLFLIADALGVSPHWLATGQGPMEGITQVHSSVVKVLPSAVTALGIGTPIITWDKPEDLPEGEFVIVPRFDVHVSAGNGHVVCEEQNHEQGQAYRTDSIRNMRLSAKNLMTVYAKGESMEPSIYAGDALLVDRSQTAVQDRLVYILRYGDEVRVKRLFRRPDGGLRIVSDNAAAFPEEVVPANEMQHIEIIGRVVERSGRM